MDALVTTGLYLRSFKNPVGVFVDGERLTAVLTDG